MIVLLRRRASTLVFVEHKNGKISNSTLNTLTAAFELKSPVSALVASEQDELSIIGDLKKYPITKIYTAKSPKYAHNLPEMLVPLFHKLQLANNFDNWLFNSSSVGRNLSGRFAGVLQVSCISEIVKVESQNVFKRNIYAGNAVCTVKSEENVKIATVRSTAFAAIKEEAGGNAVVESVPIVDDGSVSVQFIKEETVKSDRPELGSAKVVVSGGRGLKSMENFKLLYQLADTLNGAVGASRAAVDAGYASNDLQVGQTGKVVAPTLYIAVGISGAIQHIAGMKDSKCIVAINKDADAPIFQIADYGLVDDLFKAIPEMTTKLSNK